MEAEKADKCEEYKIPEEDTIVKVGIPSVKRKATWPLCRLKETPNVFETVKYVENESSANYHVYTFICTRDFLHNKVPKIQHSSMSEYGIPVDIM